jgi:hypothetical protein
MAAFSVQTMPSSVDRLLQFIIEHEGCEQELEVGHVDHQEEATDIVLRCPSCGASVAIPVTVDEAEAFMQNKGRAAFPTRTFCGRWIA